LAVFVERYHRAIVIIMLVMTGLLALQLPGLRLDSSFEGWVHGGGGLHRDYSRFTARFGPDDRLLIVFRTHDLMASGPVPAGAGELVSESPLDRYLDLVAGLGDMPAVTGVIDPVGIYLDHADPEDGLALALKDQAATARMRDRLSRSLPGDWGPLAAGDLQTLGLLILLDPARRQDYPEAVRRIREAFGGVGIPFHLAGVPYFSATLAQALDRDLTLVLSLLTAIALGVLFFFLRSPWLVSGILAGIGAGLIATLGLGLLLGIQLTLLTLILFPLLFCVGLTTAIHFFSRRQNGRWTPDHAYARVLRPATMAMATTAIGTGAFLFAPQPAIRDMGILLPLGIVLTYVSVMLFTPALFRWISGGWRLPPARHGQAADSPLGPRLRRGVSLLLAAAALGSAFLAGNIRINPDAIFFFQPDSELVRSYRQIEDRLVGLMTVELMITAAPGTSVLDADRRGRIESFLAAIDGMPSLTSRASGLDLRSPAYLAEDRRALRISLHYRNLASQDFSRVERDLRRNWASVNGEGSGLGLIITGQLPLILMAQDRLLRSQARVFLLIFLLVSLLLFAMLRSGRILGLALLANFIPLLITAGAMVVLDIAVNSINLFVASVLLGVIVDDTIHLLYAYRASGDMALALAEVKPALWITSVTVALAFAALWISQIVPVVQFGLLSFIAVASAYLCDTCLLPVLAPAGRMRHVPAR